MDVVTVPLESPLLISRENNVVVLTLNRPRQFNALSLATLYALHAALDTIRDDTATRVVVIAANGNAFCAGHDLKEMRAANDQALVTNLFRLCSDMMLKIVKLPVPVIAEVNGMATAAGCQLVAQCDLAVAVDQARFAVSGVNLGLFCSTPAVPLSRTIARKRAAEMLLTGEFIDAATALEWGLVNRVVAQCAARGDVEAGSIAPSQTTRDAGSRQSIALPANGNGDRSGICGCNRRHRVQFHAAGSTRRHRGIFGKAQTGLGITASRCAYPPAKW